jgi:hypothetical protein
MCSVMEHRSAAVYSGASTVLVCRCRCRESHTHSRCVWALGCKPHAEIGVCNFALGNSMAPSWVQTINSRQGLVRIGRAKRWRGGGLGETWGNRRTEDRSRRLPPPLSPSSPPDASAPYVSPSPPCPAPLAPPRSRTPPGLMSHARV